MHDEKNIIDCILHDNNIYYELEIESRDFMNPVYKMLHELIGRILDDGNEADQLSLMDYAKKKGCYDFIEDAFLKLNPISSANAEYYSGCILKRSRINKIHRTAKEILEINEPEQAITEIDKLMDILLQRNDKKIIELKEYIKPTIEQIEKHYENKGKLLNIGSGYNTLDSITTGFPNGSLIIIAARPSIGKTSFALNIAVNIAFQLKRKVGFFSCEMNGEELTKKIIADIGKVSLSGLQKGFLRNSDFTRIHDSIDQMSEVNFYIDDTPNIKLIKLIARSKQMKRRGVEIIFIDYLTLIQHENSKMPRHERIGNVSKRLKQLARELDLPILVLSQVGRQSEGREPGLADLRQSGEIEEDADMIIFLHRERKETETSVMVAKNRNGSTGEIRMLFLPEYTRFEQYTGGKE